MLELKLSYVSKRGPIEQSAGNEFRYLYIISLTIKDFLIILPASYVIHNGRRGLTKFSLLLIADD